MGHALLSRPPITNPFGLPLISMQSKGVDVCASFPVRTFLTAERLGRKERALIVRWAPTAALWTRGLPPTSAAGEST